MIALNSNTLSGKNRLQALLLLAAAFVFFRLSIGTPHGPALVAVNEVLVGLLVWLCVISIVALLRARGFAPLKVITAIGILQVVLMVAVLLSEPLLALLGVTGKLFKTQAHVGAVASLFSLLFNAFVVFSAGYTLYVLRELFYLKQKRNLRTYFNAMLVFIVLSAATAVLKPDDNLNFINLAFTVNAIILIVINSLRSSWIAFLSKKEKRNLLLLSVGMAIVFGTTLSNIGSSAFAGIVIDNFSYSLRQFLMLINTYGLIYFSALFVITLFHLPTAEAFDRKSREISSLQYFSKLINRVLDFKELADCATDLAMEVNSADAAWIVLTDSADASPVAPKKIGYAAAASLFASVAASGTLSGSSAVSVFEISPEVKAALGDEKFFSLILARLKTHVRLSGYLLLARKSEVPFDEDDRNSLETFADYVAVAMENSRLFQESIEKERMERELDVAREMQKKLIPAAVPAHPGLDIAAVFIPAFEVGGDYYDFFELSDSRVGFTIADVSGKGISAAFIMAEIRGIFESLSRLLNSPRNILVAANQTLERTLGKKNFISALFGIINTQTASLSLARAGHLPLLLFRGGTMTEIAPKGVGLGLNYSGLFSNALEEIELPLLDNDLLVLFTDGVTEAKNAELADFGIQALKQIINENSTLPAAELANRIIREVTLFSQSVPQHDDITIVIIKWKSKAGSN